MAEHFDPNQGVKESEMAKNLKESMFDCLHGEPDQCKIQDCLASELRSGLGYCKVHWNQKLRAKEEELEKKYKADRKRQAKIDKSPKLQKEVTMGQRLQVWFNTHRTCAFCGHYCDFTEGHAQLKSTIPKRQDGRRLGQMIMPMKLFASNVRKNIDLVCRSVTTGKCLYAA